METTVLMCTATQPLLNQLTDPEKGQLHLPKSHKLTPDVSQLFDELMRVNIVDKTNSQGWSLAEITQLAADEMEHKKIAERDNNLLNLLSLNNLDLKKHFLPSQLKHAFMTAGKLFKVIDALKKSLIVLFGEGKPLLDDLCCLSKKFDAKAYFDLVKACQKYSVNLFPNIWQKLVKEEAIIELMNERGEGDGIFYLKEQFYSDDFGVSVENCALQQELIC
jgi:hypothetical protein